MGMADYVEIIIAMKIVGVDDPVHPGQTESSAPTRKEYFRLL